MTQPNGPDRGRLLRAIAAAVTDGHPAPGDIYMQSNNNYAVVKFDDIAAVDDWAALIGAKPVHGRHTYEETDRSWYEYGTRPGGAHADWQGWQVEIWCVVEGRSPEAPKPATAAAQNGCGDHPNCTYIAGKHVPAPAPLDTWPAVGAPSDVDADPHAWWGDADSVLSGLVEPAPKQDKALVDYEPPQDGHVYECCGKVGRISRHNSWCPIDAEGGAS